MRLIICVVEREHRTTNPKDRVCGQLPAQVCLFLAKAGVTVTEHTLRTQLDWLLPEKVLVAVPASSVFSSPH